VNYTGCRFHHQKNVTSFAQGCLHCSETGFVFQRWGALVTIDHGWPIGPTQYVSALVGTGAVGARLIGDVKKTTTTTLRSF